MPCKPSLTSANQVGVVSELLLSVLNTNVSVLPSICPWQKWWREAFFDTADSGSFTSTKSPPLSRS